MKAVWTPELAQDLNAYHSVDAEAELTSLLSEYVSMEIDLEILDMLHMNALAKTERWSARVGFEFNSAGLKKPRPLKINVRLLEKSPISIAKCNAMLYITN